MDFSITAATNEEFIQMQGALEELLGEEGKQLSWVSRVIRPDPAGPFQIRILKAEKDLRGRDLVATYCPDDPARLWSRPWLAPTDALGVVTLALPLAEGVELLRGPDNPEIEILRRRQLTAEYEETLRQAQLAAAAVVERELQRESEERELDRRYHDREWHEMPPLAQVATLFALALEDGLQGAELARVLRDLAATATNKAGGFRSPRRVWWRS